MLNRNTIIKTIIQGQTLLLLISLPAFARGIEIGGGTNDPGLRPVQCEKDIVTASHRALAILRNARAEAASAAITEGVASFRHALVNGLRRSAAQLLCATPVGEGQTLLLRSVLRGIELDQALMNPTDPTRRDHEMAIYFLNKYYDFIDRTVASLDNLYYIPCLPYFSCRLRDPSCALPVSENDFVIRYEAYGKALLELLANNAGRLGSDIAEVKVTALIADWVAADFSESLFARSLESYGFQLSELTLKLADHLAGSSSFGDDRMAVIYGRQVVASILRNNH